MYFDFVDGLNPAGYEGLFLVLDNGLVATFFFNLGDASFDGTLTFIEIIYLFGDLLGEPIGEFLLDNGD